MTARDVLTLFLACNALLVLQVPKYLELEEREGFPIGALVLIDAARWYSWMLVVPFIHRVVRRASPHRRVELLGRHAAIAITFSALQLVTVTAAERRVFASSAGEPFAPWAAIVPNLVLYTAVAVGLSLVEGRRRRHEADARMRAELAEARLDALRQQLNPHFLFNTLNHIVMQMRLRRSDEALDMLLTLSDLLRLVLTDREHLTTVRKELEGVELYLQIERARFGSKLSVSVTVDSRVLDAQMPTLLLQPLLENAMRHGVSPDDGRCHVTLTIRAEGDRLQIEIRDLGPGLGPPAGGIGVGNTRARLRHLYGDDHHFELRPRARAGAAVDIDLPLRK